MIKLSGLLISIFLIIIIFLQIPDESVGLSSFTKNMDQFSSPGFFQRFIKLLTAMCILGYIGIALQLNR